MIVQSQCGFTPILYCILQKTHVNTFKQFYTSCARAGALFPGGRGGQHVLDNARARREGDEDCARRDGDAEEDGRLRERGGRHNHAATQGAHRQARGIQERGTGNTNGALSSLLHGVLLESAGNR
jgi:hypothetical protein